MTILKDMRTPIFYIEGTPSAIDLDTYTIGVFRDKEKKEISFRELESMPMVTVDARLTSVSGFTVRADWQGVRWTDFARLCKLPSYPFVEFKSWSFYTSCVPADELAYEKVLLCYKVNGDYLEKEYGAPIRMFIPQLWGYKGVKGLSEIHLLDSYRSGFWEQRGYSDSGQIEAGTTYDVNSKSYKHITGGEVTEF